MDPHSGWGLVGLAVAKQQFSLANVTQALIVAGITAAATTYATTRVLEREVQYIRDMMQEQRQVIEKLAVKVNEIEMRQAEAIALRKATDADLQAQINRVREGKR